MTSALKVFILFGLACVGLWVSIPTALASRILNDTFLTKPFSHNIWQEVLSENVDSAGNIEFDRLRATPKRLNQYLKQLGQASPMNHPDLFPTRQDQLAYWINAHNALALRLVLDAYPVANLKDVSQFYQSHRYILGGIPYSLSEVEQLISRRFSHWPLALFGLSDLTVQGPSLLNQAYTAKRLEAQLQSQSQQVMQDPGLVRILPGRCIGLALSPYFQDYQVPLLRSLKTQQGLGAPTLLEVVKPFLSPESRGEFAIPCEHPITFMDVDTRLRQFSEGALKFLPGGPMSFLSAPESG